MTDPSEARNWVCQTCAQRTFVARPAPAHPQQRVRHKRYIKDIQRDIPMPEPSTRDVRVADKLCEHA